MSAPLPLQATAAGTCDATGAATLNPGGGFSPGMFSVWNATAALQRPGASVIALVNGNPVASAYGLTASLGPVQCGPNDQVSFQVLGNTPAAPVSVTIQGYQALELSDLPQLSGTANATIVNIQPQDGAELVNFGNGQSINVVPYTSGLLDVSQWAGINLAIEPAGLNALTGVSLEWFAADGVTQVGGWSSILQLPAIGGYQGAQFPFAQLLFPNSGPLVQLALSAVTGGGPNFQPQAVLFQTNRQRPVTPYGVMGPYLAAYPSFTLAAGNNQIIPLTALYSGPAAFHITNPGGATVQLNSDDGTGTLRTVWNLNAVNTSYQAVVNVPPTRAQFQVNNTSAGSLTYTFLAWAAPTGSAAAGVQTN